MNSNGTKESNVPKNDAMTPRREAESQLTTFSPVTAQNIQVALTLLRRGAES